MALLSKALTKTQKLIAEMAMKPHPVTGRRLTSEEIAAALHPMSPQSVRAELNKLRGSYGLDIPVGQGGRPPETLDRIVPLIQKGLSNPEIAEITGLSTNNIARRRNYWNSKQPEGQRWSGRGYQFGLPLIGGFALDDDWN